MVGRAGCAEKIGRRETEGRRERIPRVPAKRESRGPPPPFQRRRRRVQGQRPVKCGETFYSRTVVARSETAGAGVLQFREHTLSGRRAKPGDERKNPVVGKCRPKLRRRRATGWKGCRRQVQSGVCEEEAGGTEKATAQTGSETAAEPEPGQRRQGKATTGPEAAARFIEAATKPGAKAATSKT